MEGTTLLDACFLSNIAFMILEINCAHDIWCVGTEFFWKDTELEEAVDEKTDCCSVQYNHKFEATVQEKELSGSHLSALDYSKELGSCEDDVKRAASGTITNGVDLLLPQSLQLNDAYAGDPLPFTNLCSTFCATLDHIYVGPTVEASSTSLISRLRRMVVLFNM